MIIEIFSCGPLLTNTFLIGCEKTGMAAVVDPAYQSFEPVTSKAEELSLTLEKILLTHSHWDHIVDVHSFKEKLSLPIYIHPLDVPNLENPGVDGVPTFFPVEGAKPDVLIKEGQIIEVGQVQLEVIHTPGHSPGSVCFYVPKYGILTQW